MKLARSKEEAIETLKLKNKIKEVVAEHLQGFFDTSLIRPNPLQILLFANNEGKIVCYIKGEQRNVQTCIWEKESGLPHFIKKLKNASDKEKTMLLEEMN